MCDNIVEHGTISSSLVKSEGSDNVNVHGDSSCGLRPPIPLGWATRGRCRKAKLLRARYEITSRFWLDLLIVVFVACSSQITSGYVPRSRLDHDQNLSPKIINLFRHGPLVYGVDSLGNPNTDRLGPIPFNHCRPYALAAFMIDSARPAA